MEMFFFFFSNLDFWKSWGLEEATGQKVVGVSVCWDFQDYEDELLDAWSRQVLGAWRMDTWNGRENIYLTGSTC